MKMYKCIQKIRNMMNYFLILFTEYIFFFPVVCLPFCLLFIVNTCTQTHRRDIVLHAKNRVCVIRKNISFIRRYSDLLYYINDEKLFWPFFDLNQRNEEDLTHYDKQDVCPFSCLCVCVCVGKWIFFFGSTHLKN